MSSSMYSGSTLNAIGTSLGSGNLKCNGQYEEEAGVLEKTRHTRLVGSDAFSWGPPAESAK